MSNLPVPYLPETPSDHAVVLRSIDQLTVSDRHVRMHPERQIELITKSILRVGFTTPIIIGTNDRVLAGAARLEAARRAGMTHAPTISLAHLPHAEQRAKRPPSVHPVFLTHPITGKKVLYCNPGYAIRINELDEAESDRVLEALFEHQLQPRFLHTHVWSEGDLLIWDNIGTLHNAIPDYGPNEHRLMKRCQVMADKVFQPGFIQQALAA